MTIELKVPDLGESITEVRIGAWLKEPGEWVEVDELLVEIESDKATVQFPSPEAGVLAEVVLEEGADANVGDKMAVLDTSAERPEGAEAPAADAEEPAESPADDAQAEHAAPKAEPKAAPIPTAASTPAAAKQNEPEAGMRATPSARRLLRDNGIDLADAHRRAGARIDHDTALKLVREKLEGVTPTMGTREVERVRMSPLRKTIARRLVEAQSTAALLTTFNEIDMSRVMAMRKARGEAFLDKHGVKLGFMSFFVRAAVEALKAWPGVNAQVEDDEIVYHRYCDIGIAVSTDKGLVVPVLRNAETLGFAAIEKAIGDFGLRAREGRLALDELQGGTFTISNGGIYGSLLSTPIVSPPQSGVLGMHAIQKRPVAVGDAIELRPMMYVALTYDHRVVDGKEAVSFLKQVKNLVEDPADILFEL